MQCTSEILDRIPPHDAEAECAVLGSVLLDGRWLDELAGILKPESFYSHAHQLLWKHFLEMHDARQAIDATMVADHLKCSADYEAVGGAAYLAEIIQSVAVAAHAKHYAGIVARLAKLRQIIRAGVEMVREGYDPAASPEQVVATAETALAEIQTGDYGREPVTATEAARAFVLQVDQILGRGKSAGLPSGMATYDENFGGLFPGELTILAARPGVGKSAMASQVAYHTAARGRLSYFASLEMSAVELTSRIVCGLAGVNSKRVRTGKLDRNDQAALVEASNVFAQAALHIDDRPGMSVLDVRRASRRLSRKGLALVVIDYLQRLSPTDRRIARHEQIGQMTDGLKQLARELAIPVLVLCQLNRESEKDDRPRLSHLRESGSIEQDADVVWLLNRKCSGAAEPSNEERKAHLIVEKNRNGSTGALRMTWVPELVRYDCGWETED